MKDEMGEAEARGTRAVEVRDANGTPSAATLEIRCRRIRLLPPIGKQNRYPPLTLTVVHASEPEEPEGRERIERKLATDLPGASLADAVSRYRDANPSAS